MRKLIKNNLFTLVALTAFVLLFTACSKGDGEKNYGLQKIYMPQATTSGGINNHYLVPSGEGSLTYNFIVDKTSSKVKVVLGVLCSGTAGTDGFSVDVKALVSETEQVLGEVEESKLLPAGSYDLPQSAAVKRGEKSASFYLEVDLDEINDSANDSKKLLLLVGIANPTMYELSDSNTTTLVVIDVDELREAMRYI